MESSNDQKPDQLSGFNIDVSQRFANLTDQEVDDLLGNKHSEKTKKATAYAIRIFKDYCVERLGYNPGANSIDTLQPETLANILTKFYAEIRTKDGTMYSKNSLVCIRFGINR